MSEKTIRITGDNVQISDGYHTFDELYEHRITLYIALARKYAKGFCSLPEVWRSELHSDGSRFDGWFVLGIGKDKGRQITYHLPVSKWDECRFAQTLDRAPEFDGHSSADVLERLASLHMWHGDGSWRGCK